jgi:formiminoglutamase
MMNEGYFRLPYSWQGRVDSNKKEHLRWHQVIEYIDLDNDKQLDKGFCIIGFKTDKGVEKNKGRKGAFEAPDTIRSYLSSLPWHFDSSVKLYDAGNVVCIENLEKMQNLMEDKVDKIMSLGLFPIIIGGGHEIALGSILGNYKHSSKMPSIINFDAHFDLRSLEDGPTSGTSFSKAAEVAKNSKQPFNYFCIGIQKASNTPYLFNKARKLNTQWIEQDAAIFNFNESKAKLKDFISRSENIHLTICMDVFRADIAPGVSAPQPFGLDIERFLRFFNEIIKSNKVKSFDIAEVAPNLDVDDRTSRLAAHIIFRLVDGLFCKI